MTTVNALSEVAALMGDPARAAMLSTLMDGRAHTASELALAAGVTAPTASASGKTLVVASSHGNMVTDAEVEHNGKKHRVTIGLNAYIKADAAARA